MLFRKIIEDDFNDQEIDALLADHAELIKDNPEDEIKGLLSIDFSQVNMREIEADLLNEFGPEVLAAVVNYGAFSLIGLDELNFYVKQKFTTKEELDVIISKREAEKQEEIRLAKTAKEKAEAEKAAALEAERLRQAEIKKDLGVGI